MDIVIEPKRRKILIENTGMNLGDYRLPMLWLDELPQLIDRYATIWNLSHFRTITQGCASYCLEANQENRQVVLKLVPDAQALRQEEDYLRLHNQVQIYSSDPGQALLMEKLEPSEDLDPAELAELVKLVLASHRKLPTPSSFKFLPEHIENMDKRTARAEAKFGKRITSRHLSKLKGIQKELLTSLEPVLIHGDVAPGNLFVKRGKLILIDPDPLVAEPAYELAKMVLAWGPPYRWFLELFSELGVERDRVLAWCQIAGNWRYHDLSYLGLYRSEALQSEIPSLLDLIEKAQV